MAYQKPVQFSFKLIYHHLYKVRNTVPDIFPFVSGLDRQTRNVKRRFFSNEIRSRIRHHQSRHVSVHEMHGRIDTNSPTNHNVGFHYTAAGERSLVSI